MRLSAFLTTVTISAMRWLLGLDLRERCQGPLHLARWLVERTNGRASVAAVHVLEQDQLSLLAAAERESEGADLARRAADDTIARAGASEVVRLNELRSGAPEEVLAEAAADMTGLLIGRQAPRGRDALVRLGRVARRLVREIGRASCRERV